MNINNVIFDIVFSEGKVGHLYFPNNYGISVVQYAGSSTYVISLLQRINNDAWSADMDDNMKSVTETNNLQDVSEEQVNIYITQVKNLLKK